MNILKYIYTVLTKEIKYFLKNNINKEIRKFLEQDHPKTKVFPTTTTKKNQNLNILQKNIDEKTLKIYAYKRTSSFGNSVKK